MGLGKWTCWVVASVVTAPIAGWVIFPVGFVGWLWHEANDLNKENLKEQTRYAQLSSEEKERELLTIAAKSNGSDWLVFCLIREAAQENDRVDKIKEEEKRKLRAVEWSTALPEERLAIVRGIVKEHREEE
jgi:hypothetical protein